MILSVGCNPRANGALKVQIAKVNEGHIGLLEGTIPGDETPYPESVNGKSTCWVLAEVLWQGPQCHHFVENECQRSEGGPEYAISTLGTGVTVKMRMFIQTIWDRLNTPGGISRKFHCPARLGQL